MKLAEALINRADLQKRAEQLSHRITLNLKVQEGDTPAEEPNQLLAELNRVYSELDSLVKRINKTNVLVHLSETHTLSDAIVERDLLLKKQTILSRIASEAADRQHRYSNTEIKTVTLVDAAQLQQQIDQLAKQFRNLDTQLQAANWTTDLMA